MSPHILSRTITTVTLLAVAAVISLTGCGSNSTAGSNPPSASSAETNPSGDIPDNQAYVAYSPSSALFTVKIPEGWAQSSTAKGTTFSDKLNSARFEETTVTGTPTVATSTATTVPTLASANPGFTLTDVTPFTRPGGSGILIRYQQDAPANSVTTSKGRQAVEAYLFIKGNHEVSLTLTSPRGADNVDPWKKITDSFTWR